MEPGIYLTALVFAVVALHLLDKVVTAVSSFLAASGIRLSKPSKAPSKRDDWYMFFHRSDLIGESDQKPKKKPKNKKTNSFQGKYQRRDSRPLLRSQIPQ